MDRIIGAHVSAAGGIDKAVVRAGELGCNGVQIFTGSPRVWKSKSVDEIDFGLFEQAQKSSGCGWSVIHATYLVNLASENPVLIEKSVNALKNDLDVAGRGKMAGVVVHLGSHLGRGYSAVRDQLVELIGKILAETPDGGMFLIENSAGQKGKIGLELGEVAELIELVGSERLGWCMDTCHAHAAGYALSAKNQDLRIKNIEGDLQENLFESGTEPKVLIDEVGRLKLWDSLVCIHVNDSRDEFGSGRDRHENLGTGLIGEENFRSFLTQEKVAKIPLVLEVPGFDGKGPDQANVDILKDWVGV